MTTVCIFPGVVGKRQMSAPDPEPVVQVTRCEGLHLTEAAKRTVSKSTHRPGRMLSTRKPLLVQAS